MRSKGVSVAIEEWGESTILWVWIPSSSNDDSNQVKSAALDELYPSLP
jgi:hypothetical protein